jgi:hypothetical protein
MGSVTAQGAGVGGVVFMNGGALKGCQRSYSGIWFGCHLGGCWWCILCIYRIT